MIRPDAGEVADRVFTADHRVRRELRGHVLAEVRCQRGHLLAMIIGFPVGRFGAWRYPWVERTHSGGWEYAWCDDPEFAQQTIRCVCGGNWLVDLRKLRTRGGTVRPAEILADPVPDTSDDEADNPFR